MERIPGSARFRLDHATTAKAKFMDLNMLVLTEGGREHTQAEFEALLKVAGFRLEAVHATVSRTAIIEAGKI